jgi:hypothetical protein
MIDNWLPYFKLTDTGERALAQQTYEPLINPEGTVFCANYDWQNKYQRMYEPRPLYTELIVDWFFENEVYHILKFQDKPYMPKLLEIDQKNKKIFFEWHGKTCNEIIYSGGTLPAGWDTQIESIMLDLHESNIYKLTMYPHCHFFDTAGQMKAIDWYGCVSTKDPFIESKYMDAIVHETARFRLDETERTKTHYNLENMFKQSMKQHVLWGDQNMMFIYNRLF